MPQIRLSDRDLETAPLVHRRMGSGFDTAIRARRDAATARAEAMGNVPHHFIHGVHELERMKRTLDVRLDRDAEEVVTQWEAAMMAGLNGSVAADGTRVLGIASKTWADYEQSGGKESPITDLAEIEKNFQNSEAYRGMNSLVRKRFDRKVAVSRQRYLDAANRLYDRNRQAKDTFNEQQSDAMHERKVETNLFSPDDDFESVSREEAFRKLGRKYANLGLIANPEVIDAPGTGPADIKWKDKKAEDFFNGAYLDQLQKWEKGRCVALAQNAALGEVKIVDGKVISNEAQLKAAEAYAQKLAYGKYGPRQDGTSKGSGYFGELKLKNGDVTTEYSIGVEIDGKEREIPSLVPTLTKEELKLMVDDIIPNHKKVPETIVKKAADHAKNRIAQGLSPFANDGVARISPTEAQEIGFKLVQARATLDKRIQDELTGFGAAAIAQGDLASLEKAHADLQTAASGFEKGSRNHTTALTTAKEVDKAADGVATYDLLTRLAKGDELTMSDGKTPIFSATASDPAERRYARIFPKVHESFTDKRYRAGRATENANAEIQMEVYAAKNDPQGYLNMLADKVVEKKLSLADFNRLEAKFLKGWASGWKPGDRQKPKQMQVAEAHLETIKDKLGVDLSAAFQRTDTGALKFGKNGQLMIDEKADAPEIVYRRETRLGLPRIFGIEPQDRITWTERFTPEEVKNLIDVSTRMALNDGAEVNFDPVTGERLPDGKTHKLNAVADFAAFVDHLKDEKKVLAAADEMRRFAEQAKMIDLWAFANGNDRKKRITGSQPIIGEDEKPEKKNED